MTNPLKISDILREALLRAGAPSTGDTGLSSETLATKLASVPPAALDRYVPADDQEVETFMQRVGQNTPPRPTNAGLREIALASRRDIKVPIIEGQRSFFDFLYARSRSFEFRYLIQEHISLSRPPSDEEKRAIADVLEEQGILAGLLGLPTGNLPGENQIYVLNEYLSKTFSVFLSYDFYTILGYSFIGGLANLPVFIHRLCHEVWHLASPYRLVLVKKSYFPVGVDRYHGLAVRGDRKDRFVGLDEAITEILAIMLRARVAWKHGESPTTSPILAAGVGYSTQIAIALEVIDRVAASARLNPKEVLIRFASAGQESLLDLLGMALNEEEIQLLSQMGIYFASAVPVAEKLPIKKLVNKKTSTLAKKGVFA